MKSSNSWRIWESLIGIIIASILFSKKHNTNSFIFLDLVALSAPIGIFFGRIANFINSELYGRATDLPWSVQFVLIDIWNYYLFIFYLGSGVIEKNKFII